MNQEDKDQLCFDLLKMMKGKQLAGGSVIEGFTVTFTDKETGKKTVINI